MKAIRELLQSQHCLLCYQPASALICSHCQQDLPLFDLSLCQGNLMLWPKIKRDLPGVAFDHLFALCDYHGPLTKLILPLKFSRKLCHAKAMAELFWQTYRALPITTPEVIVPVPLHIKRYRGRHYNQAGEIAHWISVESQVPMDDSLCIRNKATDAQTGVSASRRRKNLKGAFSLRQPLPYKHIAIVDDVVTTGATVDALYRTLKQENPDLKIQIWAIAISLTR